VTTGALWHHINWEWPGSGATINGTQWDPKEKNYVTTASEQKFLPETFSIEDAE
jgi:hypothetical protein